MIRSTAPGVVHRSTGPQDRHHLPQGSRRGERGSNCVSELMRARCGNSLILLRQHGEICSEKNSRRRRHVAPTRSTPPLPSATHCANLLNALLLLQEQDLDGGRPIGLGAISKLSPTIAAPAFDFAGGRQSAGMPFAAVDGLHATGESVHIHGRGLWGPRVVTQLTVVVGAPAFDTTTRHESAGVEATARNLGRTAWKSAYINWC